MDSEPESKLISLICQLYRFCSTLATALDSELISCILEIVTLVNSMDLDSQPQSELMSLTSQTTSVFNSMDLDSQPEPLRKIISVISQKYHNPVNSMDSDMEPWDSDLEFLLAFNEIFDLEPEPEFLSLVSQTLSLVIKEQELELEPESEPEPEPESEPESELESKSKLESQLEWFPKTTPKTESELISHITQLTCIDNPRDLVPDSDADSDSDSDLDPQKKFYIRGRKLVSILCSMDLESQPESQLMSLSLQLISLLDSVSYSDITPLLYQQLNSESEAESEREMEPELVACIQLIFSLVISMNSVLNKLISLCPQVEVRLKDGKFHVQEKVRESGEGRWECLPLNWKKFRLVGGEDPTHFLCRGCNGKNHEEYNKAPLEIKHPLHPRHSLQLVMLSRDSARRECYCCDQTLKRVFYHCFACDYSMNMACAEKPPVLSTHHPKWHEHKLDLFPRMTSLTCNLCALTHSRCPFYMCPPCDFVVHQSCISLPRVIKISRHPHRISFTPSFSHGDWSCGVCQRKIDNDYGGYSCIKDGCSYVAHSKCATQKNVWDGIELEGVPEEEIEDVEPFVTISHGIIQHFSHQHHHLRLDENTNRDYDENKQCQACITPIYFGNFYSCMQCDFILHEECAKFPRKIHHPIHPHMLTLVTGYNSAMHSKIECSACLWFSTAGFFYRCDKEGCDFKLHVQCATVSEPLVHESHMHNLFLTSKPEEERRICSVCKESRHSFTNETFNCIECDFSLCFGCATLPQKLRYKHDKHMLTLSYGDKASTMTYWCEVCEGKLNPKERFYMCDEYCCVTLHLECMLGRDLYMKPGSLWFHWGRRTCVHPNNYHMSRPICSNCKERCPQKIVFEWSGSIFCSTSCIDRSR